MLQQCYAAETFWQCIFVFLRRYAARVQLHRGDPDILNH